MVSLSRRVVKHLPGQHDQLSHGNRRGGKTRQQVIDEITQRYPPEMAYSEPGDLGYDREYWDNFDQEGPTLVYHGTRKDLVEIISKEGLKKGMPWMDRPPSVYFTVKEIEARSWQGGQAIVAFRIPDEWDDDIITDAIAIRDFDWETSFRIERDIPPEYIEHIKICDTADYTQPKIIEVGKERIGYAPVICHFTDEEEKQRIRVVKGGPTSGHHGHAGRPGKVGGSAPSSRVVSSARVPTFHPSKAVPWSLVESVPSYPGLDDKMSQFFVEGMPDEYHEVDNLLYPGWSLADYDTRGRLKDDIVNNISAQTGVDYETVNMILAQWASTSNDKDMRSLSLQAAAAEEFGLEMSEWQREKYEEKEEIWNDIQSWMDNETRTRLDKTLESRGRLQAQGIDNPVTRASLSEIRKTIEDQVYFDAQDRYVVYNIPITSRENERKVLRAMYDHTQSELARFGYKPDDTIVLWRGVGNQDKGIMKQSVNYKGNVIESWSISYKVGADFRSSRGDLVGAYVPIRNILSTAKTGLGCLTEGEVITFGTIPGMEVRVAESIELYKPETQEMLLAYANKQDHDDSVMIALPVDDAEVRRLWKSYGSDEDILPLHVTLLYLGKVDELDKEDISSKLQLFADNQSSIEGEYGGAAVFNDQGDGYPIVLLFDSPQLPFAFAKLAGMLKGLRPDLLHGFTPHTTLGYLEDRPDELPELEANIPYRFNNVLLRWGGEDILFSLKGDIIEKGGPGSGHHGHKGIPGKQGGSLPRGSLPAISSDKKDVELSRQLAKECQSQSKECYKNSIMALVRVEGGKYVEGYFVIDMEGYQFPIEHGWIDKDGTIIDVTLPDDTGTYIPANSWSFKEALARVSGSGSESLLPFSNYDDINWRTAAVQAWLMLGVKIEKGGPGSGHFDHAGRPGEIGGSAPSGKGKGKASKHGLVREDTFKSGKAMWAQDGKFIKNNEGIKSHTQICARMIMDDTDNYTRDDIEKAKEVIEFNAEEYSPLERVVMEKGYTAIEVDFMGGVTIVGVSENRLPTATEFNQLFRKIKKSIISGKIDVPSSIRGADRIAIHYNSSHYSISYDQIDLISGFSINQFGKPVPHMKERKIIITKGGPGSGHFGHAGRPGKVGGSATGDGFKGKMANLDGKDTMEQYRNADGTWTPERAALHEKIMTHFFEGKTPVDDPTSYVLGGGTAAGKSTLVEEHYAHLPDNMVLANSDEIKALLPEYEGGVNATGVHEESSYLAKKIASKAANNSYNVIMDGTGDGEIPALKKKVASMRPLGQPVIGIYVTVDIETAVNRSMARAKATGRYVPESVIRYSHRMVAKIYPEIISGDLYDNVNLYDTSSNTPKLIAREVGKSFTILDDGAYQRFLERGK